MSQHDHVIDNDTFPAVRTDLNALFAALISFNSGSSAPSTTAAGMMYYNSSDGWIYQRNAADSAWIKKHPLATAGLIGQNGAAIYAADAGSTDAYAITLDPAPTAYTTGQIVNFKANTANTGACTLNVNSIGAVTIKKQKDQDLATGDIKAGQFVSVIYDGSNFQMVSPVASSTGSPGLVRLAGYTPSAAASVDITSVIDSTYDDYLIRVKGLKPGSDITSLRLAASTDNGSNWLSTSIYEYSIDGIVNDAGGITKIAGSLTTSMLILGHGSSNQMGAGTNEDGFVDIHLTNVNSTTYYKMLHWIGGYENDVGKWSSAVGAGRIQTTSAINAIQLLMSSGTLSAENIEVFGVINS